MSKSTLTDQMHDEVRTLLRATSSEWPNVNQASAGSIEHWIPMVTALEAERDEWRSRYEGAKERLAEAEERAEQAEARLVDDMADEYNLAEHEQTVGEYEAEIKRLKTLIDKTAKHWMSIEGIPWEGAIDAAMEAAVKEIARLRAEIAQPQWATTPDPK